jgi:hypothetical protein
MASDSNSASDIKILLMFQHLKAFDSKVVVSSPEKCLTADSEIWFYIVTNYFEDTQAELEHVFGSEIPVIEFNYLNDKHSVVIYKMSDGAGCALKLFVVKTTTHNYRELRTSCIVGFNTAF